MKPALIRPWMIILAVFAVAALAAVALRGQSPNHASSSVSSSEEVGVLKPQRRDLTRTLTLPADIRPYQEARVYARVSGYLKRITVDRGDWVRVGQTLAELEVPEMLRQYRRAESDMDMKQKVYRRLADIREHNPDLLALEEVEQARTDFAMARALRDELSTMMQYATVRAPFDGVVTTRYVHPGVLIQAGTSSNAQRTPIVRVMDLSRVRIAVSVPESEVAWITHETPVRIQADARPGEDFHGKVTRYAAALDPETRTMPTEIEVANPDRRLYPGMYAHVTLTLEVRRGRLTLPREALIARGDARQVFLVEEGTVKAVTVETGYEDAELVEITNGLAGDEHVIVRGRDRIRPGDRVVIRGEEAAARPDPALTRHRTGEGGICPCLSLVA